MRVSPPPAAVPRLAVENSRKTLSVPISMRVGSPWYFLSCGSSPITAWGKKRVRAPTVIGPERTTWAPTVTPSARSTSAPITA